jgi:hypothetical protein
MPGSCYTLADADRVAEILVRTGDRDKAAAEANVNIRTLEAWCGLPAFQTYFSKHRSKYQTATVALHLKAIDSAMTALLDRIENGDEVVNVIDKQTVTTRRKVSAKDLCMIAAIVQDKLRVLDGGASATSTDDRLAMLMDKLERLADNPASSVVAVSHRVHNSVDK